MNIKLVPFNYDDSQKMRDVNMRLFEKVNSNSANQTLVFDMMKI